MLKIAGVQFPGHVDRAVNIDKATRLVREAAAKGAQIICLPELFNTMYFCVETRQEYFDWAEPITGPTIKHMGSLARETGTVLICPIFERADKHFYNTAVVVGPDGQVIGRYRKSSIPFLEQARSSEPRGNEKFYFTPGDLGFPVFDTPFGARIGILICYDRHFPEAARVLGLNGADIVFVPTATTGMTRYLWDLELRAHAVANMYYVCGVNKVGVDTGGSTRNHHGASLVSNPRGQVIAQASDTNEDIVLADVDLSVIPDLRALWGFYRDRRPDLYGPVSTSPQKATASRSMEKEPIKQ
jgi:beta-ureidopropionase